MVLERHQRAGEEISARNSQVIHAGLYYPKGSLRARLCVAGRKRLYEFAGENGISHEQCGKLVVATDDGEIDALRRVEHLAVANGVDDVRWLNASDVQAVEPQLQVRAALLSPSTGIIDVHEVITALEGHATETGRCQIVFNTQAVDVSRASSDTFDIATRASGNASDGEYARRKVPEFFEAQEQAQSVISTRYVINAAGLSASHVGQRVHNAADQGARSKSNNGSDTVPRTYFGKGHYYRLAAPTPFQHLIYPVPTGAWLGIHTTRDLGGQTLFGPDLEWIDAVDYSFEDARHERAHRFEASVRRYWPGLPDDALVPAYTGIRPKLYRAGELPADFVIAGPEQHGIAGYIGLYGIESPGLTSALAIGDYVAGLVRNGA